jgi:hypothetical protein
MGDFPVLEPVRTVRLTLKSPPRYAVYHVAEVFYPDKFLPGFPFRLDIKILSWPANGVRFTEYYDVYVHFPWGRVYVGRFKLCYGYSCVDGPKSVIVYPPTIEPFDFYIAYREGLDYITSSRSPKIPMMEIDLGYIAQKIDSICTTITDKKSFFTISTPYDLKGDLILFDRYDREIFRESVEIIQGADTPLNLSLNEMIDAIDNPRFIVKPVFHAKINEYWEEDITIDTIPVIDLHLPEVQLEELIAPNTFCPNDVVKITGVVRQLKCPSKILAKITSFDEELTKGAFNLKQGEVVDLKTDLDLNWDVINKISEKHGLDIDNLKLP